MQHQKEQISREDIIKRVRSEKKYLAEKYNVSEIGLFGSFARNEQKKRSDIDLLISFSKVPDLFTYVDIMLYLKEKFGRKVDLISKNALREEIREQILKEVLYI